MTTPPPAPVFHPTYDEWKDFAAYVRQITPHIEKYGGCQIVPPPEWQHRPVAPSAMPNDVKITPIRQHVSGRDGKFQAVMEQLDPQSLGKFIEDSHTASASVTATSAADLDGAFWRAAAARPCPLYGGDTSEAGSLFDPGLKEWNLGALPGGVDHDLTQSLPMAIPGLNRSMLYFGTWRSFFALHTEDCELQGASYLHWGAPKRWYVVPPAAASRVRATAAACFPELADSCHAFLRHKHTLMAPSVYKASNIPCYSVLQTAGTFVVVLASAFHFGYNQGANCAEAVNFGLTSWLPHARTARPCTCDGQNTPHIEVPFLMRCVKAQHPEAAADWWCFCCACGETSTSFDDPADAPEGEQFECVGCGNWGHVACYPQYARAAAAGALPEQLYCVQCTDAWRGGDHAGEGWRFSCKCGRNEGASDATVGTGDAPTGRMFECDGCGAWAHTECYEMYEDKDDEELPDEMYCHRCTPGSKGAAGRRSGARKPAAAAGKPAAGGKKRASGKRKPAVCPVVAPVSPPSPKRGAKRAQAAGATTPAAKRAEATPAAKRAEATSAAKLAAMAIIRRAALRAHDE